MNERRRHTSIVVAVSLIQLCFVFFGSLILVYPAMYAFEYFVRGRAFDLFFDLAMAAIVVLPVAATVRAWFLLAHGRSSGWYLSAAVDLVLAVAYAALTSSLYTSPPSSGHTPWLLLFVIIALPMTHLAIIAIPPVRRELVSNITSANTPLPQTS